MAKKSAAGYFLACCGFFANTKLQLKAIQKIKHDLAYMDHAMIFCL